MLSLGGSSASSLSLPFEAYILFLGADSVRTSEEGMELVEEDVADADRDARMDPRMAAYHGGASDEACYVACHEAYDEVCGEAGEVVEEIDGEIPQAYCAPAALDGRMAADVVDFRTRESLESQVVGEA